jgi:glycosyltransferase involved in cell wall biosynthesis
MLLKDPLRICHITTFFPPENFGGDGIFVHRLAGELAARGHHVEVIHDADAFRLLHRGEPAPFAPPPGVVVHTLRSRFGALSPLITQQLGVPGLKGSRIRAILAAGRFDVIHYHNVSLVGGPGVLAYGDAVKLYSMHEHWLVCPMHVLWRYGREVCPKKECLRCQIHGKRPPQWWRYTGLLERSLRHVDLFLAGSEFTRARHLAELDIPVVKSASPYFLPLEHDGARSVPPSHRTIDSRPARADDGAAAVASEMTAGRPYFLFVGRLEKIKGLQNVIAAFREYRDADLLVAGDGDYAQELRAAAAGLPHVRFLGQLPYAQLRALYSGAVAAIVPSLCVETFGLVIMEAYGHGTPVIANRVGAPPEIVAETGGGIVYGSGEELARALRALRDDPALRARLGAAARAAFLARWTAEAHLRGYFAAIRDAAARKGKPDVAAKAAAALDALERDASRAQEERAARDR